MSHYEKQYEEQSLASDLEKEKRVESEKNRIMGEISDYYVFKNESFNHGLIYTLAQCRVNNFDTYSLNRLLTKIVIELHR
jgi:uncharacterized protein (UPF0335 family)